MSLLRDALLSLCHAGSPRFEKVSAVELMVDCNYTNGSAVVQWRERLDLELVEIEYNCTNTTTNETVRLTDYSSIELHYRILNSTAECLPMIGSENINAIQDPAI